MHPLRFPMDQHLTLSEARDITGKSESTIKRLLREIVADDNHPDRSAILPPPDEVRRKRGAKEPYAWKIDRQILMRRFPPETTAKKGTAAASQSAAAPQGLDAVMQVLQEQLRSKDEQIRTLEKQLDRKDEQIANANDRLRESNVLMHDMQKRLALAAPQAAPSNPIVDSVAAPSKTAQHAVPPSNKRKVPAVPKRGILARLFRRK